MTEQDIINLAVALVSVLGGWWMKAMWESLKDLRAQDHVLSEKVSKIEVLVAGEYIKRSEFGSEMQRVFNKLDSIEAKLMRD